jgi:hypothetical protein
LQYKATRCSTAPLCNLLDASSSACRDQAGALAAYEDARGVVRDARSGAALGFVAADSATVCRFDASPSSHDQPITTQATGEGDGTGARHGVPNTSSVLNPAETVVLDAGGAVVATRAAHAHAAVPATVPLPDAAELGVGVVTGALLHVATGALVASSVATVAAGMAVLAPDGALTGDVGCDGAVHGVTGALLRLLLLHCQS